MGPIYRDNPATSFPKPPAVAAAMARYLTEVGASINRGVYASAQDAGMTTLLLRERYRDSGEVGPQLCYPGGGQPVYLPLFRRRRDFGVILCQCIRFLRKVRCRCRAHAPS